MRGWLVLAVCLTGSYQLPAASCQTGPAEASEPVPVAARDLARGVTLQTEDLAFAGEARPAEGSVVGWVTRRLVKKGEPLQQPAVVPPPVVKSGDVVQAVWRSGTLEVRLIGRAMNSGAVGEPINVRVDTKRRFTGTAAGEGLVHIQNENSR